MKNTLLIAVSLAALSLTACGKKDEQPVAEASPDVAVSPAASAGQQFVDAAAASDTFEIESSKLAATQAQSAKVKKFAEEMIKAHTASTAKLKTAAAAASPALTPVPQLSPAQQQTLDTLKSSTGAAFDRAYAKAQVDAHQATLDALKAYSASGEVPSLKTFAGELVPTVTAHLNMAKGL